MARRGLKAALNFLLAFLFLSLLPALARFAGPPPQLAGVDVSSLVEQLIPPELPVLGLVVSVLVLSSGLVASDKLGGLLTVAEGVLLALYFYLALGGGVVRLSVLVSSPAPLPVPVDASVDLSLDLTLAMALLITSSVIVSVKGLVRVLSGGRAGARVGG